MEETPTIPQMVAQTRSGKLSRRRLTKILTGMGISAVGVSAIVTTATSTVPALPHGAVNVKEDKQKHLDLHDQHLASQSNKDTTKLYQDYHENAVVEDSMFAQPIMGREAIIARKGMTFAAATEAKITVTNRIVIGNQVTVEWIATGVHTGDLPGLPASGRSYTLSGVTVVIREDGKITREALYYDVDHLYRQLTTL